MFSAHFDSPPEQKFDATISNKYKNWSTCDKTLCRALATRLVALEFLGAYIRFPLRELRASVISVR